MHHSYMHFGLDMHTYLIGMFFTLGIAVMLLLFILFALISINDKLKARKKEETEPANYNYPQYTYPHPVEIIGNNQGDTAAFEPLYTRRH